MLIYEYNIVVTGGYDNFAGYYDICRHKKKTGVLENIKTNNESVHKT